MSLKAKIEAVIYASEEPVTLGQLVGLLGGEAEAELDAGAALQGQLSLLEDEPAVIYAGAGASEPDRPEPDEAGALAPGQAKSSEDDSNGLPEGMSENVAEPGHVASFVATTQEPSAAETRARERRLREYMRSVLDTLIAEYSEGDHGLEIREVAGGFRFATKPEYHDAVRGFVRSLKPPLKLSLQALETLAVVAYKQPVTAPEVSEIRGVDSGGVLGSLMTRKLVTTAGRKQVIGRPILYKTTKEFLLRFGLKDVAELPSIEEFERLASSLDDAAQEEIPMSNTPVVPVGAAAEQPRMTAADVEQELEPSRDAHAAQPDGDPNPSTPSAEERSAENLTRFSDGPGEFTGDETVPPAENMVNDGRLSGLPPSYDQPGDEITDSPAHDAAVQSEQS